MATKSTDKPKMVGPFSVKFPPALLEKARKKSARTGVSIAFVLRQALEKWVAKED